MPRRGGGRLLGLGLLLLRLCCAQSDRPTARKLCGRHLLAGIVRLCGDADWSRSANTPSTPPPSQATGKVESFISDRLESSQITYPVGGRGPNAVSTSASQEGAINSFQMQLVPQYQYKTASLLPNKTKEVSLSHGINSYINEIVEFQKKNTNKIKTLSKLFWGNHPQRIRRGYSEKCCLKGCTKEELIIACLPYTDYKNLQKEHQL